MRALRQGTDAQAFLFGPFVAVNDGDLALTELEIANTDILLSKNGAGLAAKNQDGGTHDQLGYYAGVLNAEDTDTVGHLRLVCKMAGALVVEENFYVFTQSVYDSLYGENAVASQSALFAAIAEPQGEITFADYLRITLAALAGVTENGFQTIRTPNGEAVRIQMTPANGDRQTIILSPNAAPDEGGE